jgi:hypothetical protein
MEWLFHPLATSSYLTAIANIVALGTAAYFVIKGLSWTWRLVVSIYQKRVRQFFNDQSKERELEIQRCANDITYFIAYLGNKLCVVIGVGVLLLLGIVRFNAVAVGIYGVKGSLWDTGPLISGVSFEYNFYGITNVLFMLLMGSTIARLARVCRRVRQLRLRSVRNK